MLSVLYIIISSQDHFASFFICLHHLRKYMNIAFCFLGKMSVAPGIDVTVLFPGESQVLCSSDKSSAVPSQKSKFSCQYCSIPMNVGDVAIFCERAGQDKVCFSISLV